MSEDKDKERILKTAREKIFFLHSGTPLRPWANLATENMKPTREWDDTFKVPKESAKNTLPSKAVLQKWRWDKDFP